MSSDPVRLVRDALEAHGCQPRGSEYSFRARCPAHDGDNPSSLSVRIGADGRVVLYCHAHQCAVEAITASLGLQVVDLFPGGHDRGRRFPLRPVKRSDFDGSALTLANVIFALEGIGQPWLDMLVTDCAYCGSPGAWLIVNRSLEPGSCAEVDCPNGCSKGEILGALLAKYAKAEATSVPKGYRPSSFGPQVDERGKEGT